MNRLTLDFDDRDAEDRFRAEFDHHAARAGRLAITIGAPGFVLMLLILDSPEARDVGRAMLAALGAWIAIAWTRWYPRIHVPTSLAMIAVLSALSMRLFLLLPPPTAVVVAIAFITLNFVWILIFLRLRFPWAVLAGAGYLAIVVMRGAAVWNAYGQGDAPAGMIPQLAGTTGGALLLSLYGGFLLILTASVTYRLERAERIDFVRREQLAAAHRRSEELLINVLPTPIAERLKAGEQPIADQLAEVSVVFADIIGFTEIVAALEPGELIALLNEIFTRFDRLAERHGLEKIKTIGDAYMAVAGAPRALPDHAVAAAEMALDMIDAVAAVQGPGGRSLAARVGVASGPAIAGVIGTQRFSYDLWGDTVNTASRMESHGTAGRVHVADATRRRLAERYVFEDRGRIEVKGKGSMQTWLLVGRRPAP
jgi:class 3 adenylate cyclase